MGRWTAADPAGLVDGLNLYRYSRDNPILFSDPGGTRSQPSAEVQINTSTNGETGEFSFSIAVSAVGENGAGRTVGASGGLETLRSVADELARGEGVGEGLNSEQRQGLFETLAGIEKDALDAQAAANPIRSEADIPVGEPPEGNIFVEADRELREEAAERERLKEIDKPLETPPVDPIDLIGPGGLLTGLLKGVARGIGNFLSKKATQAILGDSVEKAITQGAKEGVEAIIPRVSNEIVEEGTKKVAQQGVSKVASRADRVKAGLERTKAIRESLKAAGAAVGKDRTVATASVRVGDLAEEVVAISGRASRGATVGGARIAGNTARTGPGRLDAEVKILDDLAAKLSPTAQGTIDLFVDRLACGNCAAAIIEFRKAFPGIRLNVLAP